MTSGPEINLGAEIGEEKSTVGQIVEKDWWRTGTALDGLMVNPDLRSLLNIKPDDVERIRPFARAKEVFGEEPGLSYIVHYLAWWRQYAGKYPEFKIELVPDADLDLFGRLARLQCETT